jgi:hypothetical protein
MEAGLLSARDTTTLLTKHFLFILCSYVFSVLTSYARRWVKRKLGNLEGSYCDSLVMPSRVSPC